MLGMISMPDNSASSQVLNVHAAVLLWRLYQNGRDISWDSRYSRREERCYAIEGSRKRFSTLV